jgi:hypothetical protein
MDDKYKNTDFVKNYILPDLTKHKLRRKVMIWISIGIFIFTYILFFSFFLSISIINIFFILLLPLLLGASFVWSCILLYQIKVLEIFVIPLLILSLMPITEMNFWTSAKILEIFKSTIVLQANYETTPASGEKLTLRENKQFDLEEISWFSSENFKGNYYKNKDTVFLTFENNKPDFIKEKKSLWVIDSNGNSICYIRADMFFEIIKN